MSNATTEQLRSTITEMDRLSQSAFSEIASMARLALLAMAQPSTYANGCGMDKIAHLLNAITSKAEDIQNCTNAAAEEVDSNYVDTDQLARWAAQQKASELVRASSRTVSQGKSKSGGE